MRFELWYCHEMEDDENEKRNAFEEAEGVMLRLCVDCCLKKGYAHYKEEKKGEKVLTFFIE